MLEVYVQTIEGRALDQKRAIAKDITAAVVADRSVAFQPARSVPGPGRALWRPGRPGEARPAPDGPVEAWP